ncbi:MAG: hypothetical protein NTY10_06675 [Candidatus Omnitrophica bacterium]|nr:hypothetical protein [Candidatus Omnitrophota bacterium]
MNKVMRLEISAVFCLVALFFFVTLSEAKVIHNPDSNTLWIEDGIKVETGIGQSADHWISENTTAEVKEAQGGGIIFNNIGIEANRYATGRYLPIDPAYPYITWEITNFKNADTSRSFNAAFQGLLGMGISTYIPEGIYVYNPFVDKNQAKTVTHFRIDVSNCAVTFKYLKMVKVPENYIEVTSPAFSEKKRLDIGDSVTFKVILAKPAEDVSLTFFDSYIMPQIKLNDSQILQLKPVEGNPAIWQATIKIDSCEGDNLAPGKQFDPGRFLIKAVVLGGGISVPIWTPNTYEFRLKK